jgi:Na+-driven multidrug efflux pump
MRVSLISAAVIRTAVTFLLTSVIPLGLAGIWLGVLADQISRFVFYAIRFRKGEWVRLKI